MNPKEKLTGDHDKKYLGVVSKTRRLRACLLLAFGIFVLCAALLEYAVVKLHHPSQTGVKNVSLLLVSVALPAYFIGLFIREYFNTWRQRKRVDRMVTQLNEHLSSDKAGSAEISRHGVTKKSPAGDESDNLVREIVNVINA